MHRTKTFDIPLFICLLILAGLGIIFIFSSSYPKALISNETGGNASYFVVHQIAFAAVSIVLMLGCMYIPLAALRRMFWGLVGIAGALLMFALVIARAKHGHQSYIVIGPVQFMPSEFVKIALVLTTATFLSQRPWLLKTWKGMWSGPFWFLLIPAGMIALQQDLGTMLVVSAAMSTILLISGAKFRFIGIPLLVGLGLIGLLLASGHAPERVSSRVKAWMNTEDISNPASYHPRVSLLAVGSGGLLGMGFCQSRQKWFYMPAAQNDYIFAITAEEWGFLGILALVFLPFLFIAYRGFTIAHRAPNEYTALVAAGCTVMLLTPAIINMAMVLNCLPSIGVNLPFISYGGSSITSTLMLGGLLLNVSSLRAEQPAQAAAPDTTAEATPARARAYTRA